MSSGGRIITGPIQYTGEEVEPHYLEVVKIPRGKLIEALEKYGRLCFEQGRERMQAIDRTPWSGYDHFANSDLSHTCIDEIAGKE